MRGEWCYFKSYFENGNIEFSGTTDSSSLAISNLIGELIQYNEDGEIKTKFLFHKNGIMEELPNKSVVSSSNTNYTTQTLLHTCTLNSIINYLTPVLRHQCCRIHPRRARCCLGQKPLQPPGLKPSQE